MVRLVPTRGAGVTAVGFALIAVTYGLIRFSYGQFMPIIRNELGLTESTAGLISCALFIGNCGALLFAAMATERFGGRAVATVAGAIATLGLVGMAASKDEWAFAAWLMLAGSSAGLSMPPLVAAIVETVKSDRQPLATTIVNAGTSVGIIISGPIAIYFAGLWRMSFSGFAVIALATTVATVLVLPKSSKSDKAKPQRLERIWKSPATFPLLGSAFLFGVVCASFWTFGGEILSSAGGWSGYEISWFWILIGAAGLLGAPAGSCVNYFGVRPVHRFSFLMMAASIILLGLSTDHAAFAIIAGGLFGVLYILQTGLYLVWGMKEVPDRPAAIVAASFFMLPLGQVAGSVLMGFGMEFLGTKETLFCFVLLCLMGALYIPPKGKRNELSAQPA